MLDADADDANELRALQERAYGRDGGLSAVDAARLEELEKWRVAAAHSQTHPQPRVEDVPDEPTPPLGRAELPEPVGLVDSAPATTATTATAATTTAPASLRSAIRRHWGVAALACAGLLVVGLGAGWALFGRDGGGVPLSSEEQQRSIDLQSAGDYDPGSIEAIGRDGDAIVWFGTKKNGDMECIVLDVAGESSSGCQIAGEPERSYGLSAAVVDSSGADGSGEQISATADRTHTGEMIALIQRWELDMDDWIHQFDPGEQDRAEELFDRGYEPFSLAVMGYAGGAPVWSATRTEGFTTQQCLIVDAVEATNCTDANDGMIPGEGVVIEGVTVDDMGGQTTPWAVTLDFTSMGRSYLIVTGELPAGPDGDVDDGEITTGTITVRPGESLDVDEELGEPLPVDVPPAGEG